MAIRDLISDLQLDLQP